MRKGIKIKNLSHSLQFKMKQSGRHNTYWPLITIFNVKIKRVWPYAKITKIIKIILDLDSTADSLKSKRGSGDTPTHHVWLCKDPHGSVVEADYVHILRTLSKRNKAAVKLTRYRAEMTLTGPEQAVDIECRDYEMGSGPTRNLLGRGE